MSHFYGSIPYSARKTIPTARGHKRLGLIVRAASWQGAIEVHLHYDEELDQDCFVIQQTLHHGQGAEEVIATGILGKAS